MWFMEINTKVLPPHKTFQYKVTLSYLLFLDDHFGLEWPKGELGDKSGCFIAYETRREAKNAFELMQEESM